MLVRSDTTLVSRDIISYIVDKYATTSRERERERERESACVCVCVKLTAPTWQQEKGGHVFDVNYKTLSSLLSTLARGQRRHCGAFPTPVTRS